MHESPEVAILQHASGVMQVANNAFENGITYFTNLIYMSIQFAVGNGDCAPFVGHNAFLRWKAVQAVSFEEDGMRKFWSDNHVSEDFDISLRMQMNKFVVRLATYHHGGFKEGVSLTVYDELARWEKYALAPPLSTILSPANPKSDTPMDATNSCSDLSNSGIEARSHPSSCASCGVISKSLLK
jgi:hypothetical protein